MKTAKHKSIKATRFVIWLILCIVVVSVFAFIIVNESCTFYTEKLIEPSSPATLPSRQHELLPTPSLEDDEPDGPENEQIEVNATYHMNGKYDIKVSS